jgi:hypothetical protein
MIMCLCSYYLAERNFLNLSGTQVDVSGELISFYLLESRTCRALFSLHCCKEILLLIVGISPLHRKSTRVGSKCGSFLGSLCPQPRIPFLRRLGSYYAQSTTETRRRT